MAWSAFSAAERISPSGFGLIKLKDREAFKAAEEEVQNRAEAADGGLAVGVLTCETCGHMLKIALVGNYSTTDGGWTPDQLRAAYDIANWDFPHIQQDAWAYWSARLWLRTCAELGLGASMG